MSNAVDCPICGVSVPFDSPDMPFCSDRCRLIDLGNWADEKYVIGSSGPDELQESDELRLPEARDQ